MIDLLRLIIVSAVDDSMACNVNVVFFLHHREIRIAGQLVEDTLEGVFLRCNFFDLLVLDILIASLIAQFCGWSGQP